jgi:LmbE family N-acetylglucosaminyl deacetylase
VLRLGFDRPLARPPEILCLGAHSDDIEIGCGGTLLRLIRQYPGCILHWVVFSATDARADEARRAAALFGYGAQLRDPLLKTFRDGFMPFSGAEVKAVFEELKRTTSPDLILTHRRNDDAHQDHRLIAELTWNTFRDHFILEYEIPKYDGDIGQPVFFVPLDPDICEQKVRYLMDVFESQRHKRWFDPATFRGLMRLRGMECNAPSGYAEAFYCRKIVF